MKTLEVRDVRARLRLDVSAVATELVVETGGGDAFPAAAFQIQVGSEIILVGTRTAATFSSLTRGVEGTAAVVHNPGESVAYVLGAQSILDALAALAP